MKKFLKRLLIAFSFIVLLDICLGGGYQYLTKNAVGGVAHKNYYIANQLESEMLIMGSSRALQHYDPRILSDSTHLSCYNCGNSGYGIILMYSRLERILERYTPKVLLYEVTREYDIEMNDNTQYLEYVRDLSGLPSIDSLIYRIDPTERYKMISNMYKLNSRTQLLLDMFKKDESIMGYVPINTQLKEDQVIVKNVRKHDIDPIKLEYLSKMIKVCKGKNIIFIMLCSPTYNLNNSEVFEPVRQLCMENSVPFIDHYTDSLYRNNISLWGDLYHLNQTGASLYSSNISSEILQILN